MDTGLDSTNGPTRRRAELDRCCPAPPGAPPTVAEGPCCSREAGRTDDGRLASGRLFARPLRRAPGAAVVGGLGTNGTCNAAAMLAGVALWEGGSCADDEDEEDGSQGTETERGISLLAGRGAAGRVGGDRREAEEGRRPTPKQVPARRTARIAKAMRDQGKIDMIFLTI